MEKRELGRRTREVGLTTLTVGVLAAAVALSKDRYQPEKKIPTPPTAESIFRSETQAMAQQILDKVKQEDKGLSFPDDPNVKNSVAVLFETGNQSQTYRIEAFMKMADGKPNPGSTYMLILEKKFPDTGKTEQSVAIVSPALDPGLLGPNWHGESTTYDRRGKLETKLMIDSAGLRRQETNAVKQFAHHSQALLDKALNLPVRHDIDGKGESA